MMSTFWIVITCLVCVVIGTLLGFWAGFNVGYDEGRIAMLNHRPGGQGEDR